MLAFAMARPWARCLNAQFHLILTTSLWKRHYYPYLTDEQTEADRRGKVGPCVARGTRTQSDWLQAELGPSTPTTHYSTLGLQKPNKTGYFRAQWLDRSLWGTIKAQSRIMSHFALKRRGSLSRLASFYFFVTKNVFLSACNSEVMAFLIIPPENKSSCPQNMTAFKDFIVSHSVAALWCI